MDLGTLGCLYTTGSTATRPTSDRSVAMDMTDGILSVIG